MPAEKNIRVDGEVWAALGKKAIGFETPNAVLRRMLELPPAQTGGKRRPRRPDKLVKRDLPSSRPE